MAEKQKRQIEQEKARKTRRTRTLRKSEKKTFLLNDHFKRNGLGF